MKQNKRSKRKSISTMFAIVSFFYLVPSGILMHFSKNIRIESLTHVIMSLHWISSIIFLLAIATHLSLNSKAMKRYIITNLNESITVLNKEFIVVIIITSAVTILFATHGFHLS